MNKLDTILKAALSTLPVKRQPRNTVKKTFSEWLKYLKKGVR